MKFNDKSRKVFAKILKIALSVALVSHLNSEQSPLFIIIYHNFVVYKNLMITSGEMQRFK